MGSALTPVSFAVLGQLAVRPHSAYELVKLAPRWGTPFWSTAESVIYAELRKLSEQRLALSKAEATGRRGRTIYRISALGRRRLRSWLATPPAASPVIQFEAMLRVLFADHGTIDDLRRAIGTVRAFAEAEQASGRAIAADYTNGDAPYPNRGHIVQLTFAYQWGFTEHLLRWADWAEATTNAWEDASTPQQIDLAVFRQALPVPSTKQPRATLTSS